jgi:pimeloyl-ACP methyl ester carboxylesterase
MTSGMPEVPGVAHRTVAANGVGIHVAEAGEGPPVLLLHGWPQHWYMWRDVIPLVAPHARTIAPDFRGFGWSDVPERGYEKDQLARDMLAVLDELGVGDFSVAGHDWGGYVGFLLALEHPERVRSLLALNVPPPWPARDRRTLLDAWRFLYMPVLSTPGLGGRAGRAIAARTLPAEREEFVARLDGERAAATERLYRSFFLRELPAVARGRYSGSDLKVPAKLLFGVDDPVMTVRAITDAAAQADSLELELVPDTSHFIVDERPELVADRLLASLG